MESTIEGEEKWVKQTKSRGNGSGKQGEQNFSSNRKLGWDKKGCRNAVQGKGTAQTLGNSSSGSVAMVTTETGTQVTKQKKNGLWRKPCMDNGGKHEFKDFPEWKRVQALIKDDKKIVN